MAPTMNEWTAALGALLLAAGCSHHPARPGEPFAGSIDDLPSMGIVDDDPEIREFVLRGETGLELRFLNYGGVITAIHAADRHGERDNVVLGYGSESEYRASNHKNLFGAIVGRFAGRIADSRFDLDGRQVRLRPNLGRHALHGGAEPGLAQAIWKVRPFKADGVAGAHLAYRDEDGSQGFPGALDLQVTYSVMPDDSIRIDYRATTDAPTVINLTNHTYFNLAGAGSGTIERHLLAVKAEHYLETDGEDIPTGRALPVEGTPLDFRTPVPIGKWIDARVAPLDPVRGGYNHTLILGEGGDGLSPEAVLKDPETGRVLTVRTTEPGLHFYTGDYFDGQELDPRGKPIAPRDGIALETMHFSDSPNRPNFPTTVLRPGETFRSTTVWRFTSE